MSWFEFGTEIIAIEDSDFVGKAESAATIGEVTFRSLQEFADVVLQELGERKISVLHVQVHGNNDGIDFGYDTLCLDTFDVCRAQLDRLRSKFISNGWVNLRACNIGNNTALMHRLRKLWNVGVVAGMGGQINVVEANSGWYRIVYPNGTEALSWEVPRWVNYDLGRRLVGNSLSKL